MGDKRLAERLFNRPQFSERQNAKSFLYFVESPKMKCEIFFESRVCRALWRRFECDPLVSEFNFAVEPQDIVGTGETRVQFKPRAVSRDQAGRITVHWWDSALKIKRVSQGADAAMSGDDADLDEESEMTGLIKAWCSHNALASKKWSVYALENLDRKTEACSQLIPYANPGLANLKLRQDLCLAMAKRRVWTVESILRERKDQEEPVVMAAIAWLILRDKIHSDIGLRDFGKATELSIFHALPLVEGAQS